jgi:hypothetical protein
MDSEALARIEARLDALHDMQTKIFYGLIGLVAASLGVKFTETNLSKEAMIAGSYIMVAGTVFLILMMFREWSRTRLSGWLILLILGLWGFGLPAMIFGSFWLPMWGVGILRVMIGVGAAGMAWDMNKLNGRLRR